MDPSMASGVDRASRLFLFPCVIPIERIRGSLGKRPRFRSVLIGLATRMLG